jgi:BMFP domain-containing protein YqiC
MNLARGEDLDALAARVAELEKRVASLEDKRAEEIEWAGTERPGDSGKFSTY